MSLDRHAREAIGSFFDDFAREPLYQTGFYDAVTNAGARSAGADPCAWSYVHGCADTARAAANEYMSTQWQICHLMGIATGMFHALHESTEDESARAIRCVEQYRRELVALVEQS